MNKKQIIEKIVNDLPMSDMLGKMTKEEWYGWFEECWDKAINYTHCCKSDSELLKDKPKLNFEDWYITYGFAKSVTGNFVKKGIRYTLEEMQFRYDYNMP